MMTEQNAVAEILDLLPEESPAIELINAAIDQPDDPAMAMRTVVANWAIAADSEGDAH